MIQHLLEEFFDGKEIRKIEPNVVARGAAILAATLSGQSNANFQPTIIDVIPRTIYCQWDPSVVLITLREGEAKPIQNNPLLGKFRISGYEYPLERQTSDLTLKVLFTIDEDGILRVSHEEMSSTSKKSFNAKDEISDMRYKIPNCYCKKQAAIRVVDPTKETEGKLFCNCKTNKCSYFGWLDPVSFSLNDSQSSSVQVPTMEEEIQSNSSGMNDDYAEFVSICQELTSKMKHLDGVD
ncbi:hypothetical protein BUALT_Bualt01G0192700 [Buddleja alternifolia]|uniref:GRF-type domain-containing protein n=1 Tax=Buddleja alternifolia TaxID=168488 RepID=A0AAV6YEV9_9LAMI|nr:hypothetical protein BUALT_Bualt01G0192700 [Buddleja alternifolia]